MKINHCHTQTRTRREFRFRSGPVPVSVEFGLVPVPVDLAGTTPVPQFFSMLYYRFYDELPASARAPSSSLAGSCAPLQFPDCITCCPKVPRLHHVLSSSSLAVSHASCSPPVPSLYHVLPSSSLNVLCPTPPPFCDTWRGKFSNSKSKLHIYIG